MPSDQDDVDNLFGGAPAAAPTPLAANPSTDHRKESRVRANWRARVLVRDQRIVELNIFDLSESGMGLISEIGIPPFSVLTIVLAVPGQNDATRITPVSGTIKTTHMTVRGQFIHCGGAWVEISADGRELVNQWMRRLRK
jgi:hypothetical protein